MSQSALFQGTLPFATLVAEAIDMPRRKNREKAGDITEGTDL
jgi:hypothetical protein